MRGINIDININIWRVLNIAALVQFYMKFEGVGVRVVDYLCVTREEIIVKHTGKTSTKASTDCGNKNIKYDVRRDWNSSVNERR